MSEKNLQGIRVLDFTRVLAGPYLTQMLCDLGAEIIRIEQPGSGADERAFGPIINGQSGYYMMLSRGKKSVAMNLKDPRVKKIIFSIAARCDIITENFKPGVMQSLGLSYEAFRAVKPDIVMCSISTFGQVGPYATRPGYDIIAQAMSGLLWMTGDPAHPPMRSGTSIGDVNASAHALGAILAALYYREKSGKGQYIDISMRDCLSAILETSLVRHTMSGGADKPERSGAHHPTLAPYGVFDAGRGEYLVLGGLSVGIWKRLCEVLNKPEWVDHPEMNTPAVRGNHKQVIIDAIEAWLQTRPSAAEAAEYLARHDVPCAPVQTIAQLMQDPQFLLRGMTVEVTDPIFGPVELPATPMQFSETSTYNPVPPPLLGEHTEAVLKEFGGCGEADIAALRADGVIG